MKQVLRFLVVAMICASGFAGGALVRSHSAEAADAAATAGAPAPAAEGSGGEGMAGLKPVPAFDMPKDEFEAKTREFKDAPAGDQYIAYSIRIPIDWQQAKAPEEERGGQGLSGGSGNLFGEVARFYGPSLLDSRTYFTIQTAELSHDITARNWFLNYIFESGFTLQYMTEVSDHKIEALYVEIRGDTSYVVRAIAAINGTRIVMLLYSVPEPKWMEERPMQDNVLRSFAFQNKADTVVEDRRTYAFLDLLRFDYPASWRLLAPNIFSVEEMEATVLSSPDGKAVGGQIDVHVFSTELDTTLAQEVKKLQGLVEERGLVIGKLVETPTKFKVYDHIYFSRVEVYEANDKSQALIDHEYWIGVLMEDRYFYIVTMLTPARTADFYGWATNTEAFETVIESLRP
ncbi:MAG: hypothetical protein HYU57_00645 [Micavibrio aeruginosavorus]|nr:hypothetical protein [Micavibrio aeruginosavorus]